MFGRELKHGDCLPNGTGEAFTACWLISGLLVRIEQRNFK